MKLRTRLIFAAAAAPVVLAAPGRVVAQDAQRLPEVTVSGSRDGGTLQLNESSGTASRLGLKLRETPASVEVIDQAVMAERGKRTVMEALEGAAGINIGITGGAPGTVASRGFADGSVRYLYDGVPLIDSGMVTRPGGTFNFDRIEILRGPSSVLHGSQGIGSAVNFISKSPSRGRDPIDVELGYGTFNAWRLGLGTGGPIGEGKGAYYRLDASTNRFDTEVLGNRHEYSRLTGSLLLDLAPALSLTLSADLLRDRQDDAYWGTPLNNGQLDARLRKINYNNLTDNIYSGDTNWLRAVVDWRPSSAWEVKNSAYYYDSYRNWRNTEIYSFNPATNVVTRSSFGDLDHNHQMVGNRLEALWKGEMFGLPNRFSVGTDVNHTSFFGQRNGFPGTQNVSAFSPTEVAFNSVTPTNRFPARSVKVDQWSLFAEDQLSLTGRFKLVAGLRWDRIDADFVRTDNGAVLVAPVAHSKQWSPLGTRLGFTYDLTPATTLYGQYTSATEPVGTLLLLTQANSQFELTKGKSWEGGAKGDFWDKRGEWMASLYRIVKRDVVVPISPTLSVQAGQQSSQGVELSGGVRPIPALKLEANLALLKARFDDFSEVVGGRVVSRAGTVPQNVPERVINIGARYRFMPEVEGSAWARHTGVRFTDTTNLIQMPAYTVVDLSLGYKLDKRSEVQFWVRNATDKFYAQWRGASNNQVIVGAPRTFEVVYRGTF